MIPISAEEPIEHVEPNGLILFIKPMSGDNELEYHKALMPHSDSEEKRRSSIENLELINQLFDTFVVGWKLPATIAAPKGAKVVEFSKNTIPSKCFSSADKGRIVWEVLQKINEPTVEEKKS